LSDIWNEGFSLALLPTGLGRPHTGKCDYDDGDDNIDVD
jgi:hypothetical protein